MKKENEEAKLKIKREEEERKKERAEKRKRKTEERIKELATTQEVDQVRFSFVFAHNSDSSQSKDYDTQIMNFTKRHWTLI